MTKEILKAIRARHSEAMPVWVMRISAGPLKGTATSWDGAPSTAYRKFVPETSDLPRLLDALEAGIKALERIDGTVEIECSGAPKPDRMELANDRNWRMGCARDALAAIDRILSGEK